MVFRQTNQSFEYELLLRIMFLKIDQGLKYFFLLLIAIHFSFSSKAQSAKYKGLDLIQYEGAPYYVSGLNVPWNKFGGDFGWAKVELAGPAIWRGLDYMGRRAGAVAAETANAVAEAEASSKAEACPVRAPVRL